MTNVRHFKKFNGRSRKFVECQSLEQPYEQRGTKHLELRRGGIGNFHSTCFISCKFGLDKEFSFGTQCKGHHLDKAIGCKDTPPQITILVEWLLPTKTTHGRNHRHQLVIS